MRIILQTKMAAFSYSLPEKTAHRVSCSSVPAILKRGKRIIGTLIYLSTTPTNFFDCLRSLYRGRTFRCIHHPAVAWLFLFKNQLTLGVCYSCFQIDNFGVFIISDSAQTA